MILFKLERMYVDQWYLETMYKALFALDYYGLLRVGELTHSQHVIKACDVQMGMNKNKILVVLYSSKTHDESMKPQKVKITENIMEKSGKYAHRNFCPFRLLHNYIFLRGNYRTYKENFFMLRDKSPVQADQACEILRKALSIIGLDSALYDMQS